MKICAFSDMHGQLDFEVEDCDLVLICGDIVPLKIQNNPVKTETWLRTVFIPWCTSLPCKRVLFIAGNHDFFFEKKPERIQDILSGQDKVVYLNCECYEYDGVVIYGTPWCKTFGNWAFMRPYEVMDKMYNKQLETLGHVDIIMSHDAPYGVSDILLQEDCIWADGTHIGNESLRRFVEKVKPKVMVKGHLHSCNHGVEKLGETDVYTVSLLDENYEMVYGPLYIEI